MITQELKRTITQATDTPINEHHISLLNEMFKALDLNLTLETEEEPFKDFDKIKKLLKNQSLKE